MKNSILFVFSFRNETHIYIYYTCSEIFQQFISYIFDDLTAYVFQRFLYGNFFSKI